MTDKPYKSLENAIRETARATMQKKFDDAQAKIRLTTKIMEEPEPEVIKEEVDEAILNSNSSGQGYDPDHTVRHTTTAELDKHLKKRKIVKEEVEAHENNPIEELAPMGQPDPLKAKMDAQRQQVQKQRDQFKMQLQKQKAAKQMQADKDKGEKELEKIKETEEVNELQFQVNRRVRTFGRAQKLQALHNRQYNRLAAAGDMAGAERHRKRAEEYKRIRYMAKDNPGKLPVV